MAEPSRPRLLSPRGFGDPSISAVAISPDARLAALTTGTLAESVDLWDITDPVTPVRTGRSGASHPAVIRSVAFSPRDGLLATGSNDQTVALWRLPQGDRLAVLDGHDAGVDAIAFSGDATMVVVLDDGGTLTLWDVAEPTTPVRLHTIAAADDLATSFALGRDGRRIIVGRDSGTLEVWDIRRIHDIVSDPVRVACQLTGRGLTDEEWRLYVPDRPFRTTC
jgi:WD40 repeat protein